MVGASAAPHGWAIAVRAAAIAEFLTVVAGVDLAQLRAAAVPVERSLPRISIRPFMPADTTRIPGAAPGVTDSVLNVIGILEGRDPELKQEYLVFTAHMDPRGPNGADDNASGVAGLLALAKAFSHPTALPRRSIVFLATSGADADFVGSNFFCQPYSDGAVRCSHVVANITLDMVGRPAEDSVLMSGAQELEFAVSPKWVIAMHPELQLRLVNRELVYKPASDYFAFVRQGVPSLYFHNSDHDESSTNPAPKALTTTEAIATIDAEQTARIMRLVFYIGHNLAEAQQRPRWTAEGRRRRLQMLGSE